MSLRLNFLKTTPDVTAKLFAVQKQVEASGLDPKLVELVRLRASQINGCAFCIDLHTRAALKNGETHERMHGLAAWRLFPFYTAKERAALEWTEALTLIAEGHAPDEVYDRVRQHFDEAELVNLSWVIFLINGWNRLSVGFRIEPGSK